MPLQNIGTKIIASKNLKSTFERIESINFKTLPSKKDCHIFEECGGLPGICFIRNKQLRTLKIQDQVKTILDRDVRLVSPTTISYQQIFDLASLLAAQQGQVIDYTQLKKETELSTPTIKKLIYAFEAVFLIRQIRIEGGKKGFVIVFEDQAESNYFSGGKVDDYWNYAFFLYRNIRTEFSYQLGLNYRFFSYSTLGGAKIPFAVETPDGVLGYMPIESDHISHSELMSAQSFLKKYSASKVIFTSKTSGFRYINDRMLQVPDLALIGGRL